MREIKFRAWDKKGKRMFSVLNIYFDVGDRKPVITVSTSQSSDGLTELQDEYELIQFTGLKDKNGKEIFEGDIIRTYAYNDKWDDGAIGVVDWDDEDAGFRFNWKILLAKNGEKNFRKPISTICSQGAYQSDKRRTGIEVIGNIYKNPELLKGDEK